MELTLYLLHITTTTHPENFHFHLKLQISLKNNLQNVQDIFRTFLMLWTKTWTTTKTKTRTKTLTKTKTRTKTKIRTNNLSLGLDSNSSLMELDAADLHLVSKCFQC